MVLLEPAGPKSSPASLNPHAPEWIPSWRGEGSDMAMHVREEGGSFRPMQLSSKAHGSGQAVPLGAKFPPHSAVKRSFRRAIKRAQMHGWAVHRGHLIQAPGSDQSEQPQEHAPTRMPPKGRLGRRASILSWNAGGLTTELYQQLLAWAAERMIDILLIQGTRWKDDRTWKSHGYMFVQCGEDPEVRNSHAGVLIGVSQRLCKTDDVSFASIIPGRLQHVKCRLGSKSIDIINAYQFPDSYTQQRTAPLKCRANFWQKFDMLLHQMPHRNVLLIGGDFNCPLAGHGRLPTKPPVDISEFEGIVKKYHLGTTRAHDGGPSYIGSQGESTIDFVLLRQTQLDYPARQGRCLTDTPLACWREQTDHLPILCSISLNWTCWFARKQTSTKLSRLTQENMFQAWRLNTPQWQHFEADLATTLQETPERLSCLTGFMSVAVNKSSHCFRAPKHVQHDNPHRSLATDLWTHFRAMHRPQPASLSNVFHMWLHHVKIRSIKKTLSKACKAQKQARLLEAVRQAEIAAAHHDTRRLFCIIRSLIPRKRHSNWFDFEASREPHSQHQKNARSLRPTLQRYFKVLPHAIVHHCSLCQICLFPFKIWKWLLARPQCTKQWLQVLCQIFWSGP